MWKSIGNKGYFKVICSISISNSVIFVISQLGCDLLAIANCLFGKCFYSFDLQGYEQGLFQAGRQTGTSHGWSTPKASYTSATVLRLGDQADECIGAVSSPSLRLPMPKKRGYHESRMNI